MTLECPRSSQDRHDQDEKARPPCTGCADSWTYWMGLMDQSTDPIPHKSILCLRRLLHLRTFLRGASLESRLSGDIDRLHCPGNGTG